MNEAFNASETADRDRGALTVQRKAWHKRSRLADHQGRLGATQNITLKAALAANHATLYQIGVLNAQLSQKAEAGQSLREVGRKRSMHRGLLFELG